MSREELQAALTAMDPAITFEEGGEWLNANVPVSGWKDLARKLKSADEMKFDYLFCLTSVDWKTHLTMVYHLNATSHRHTLVVKVKLDRTQPEVETVCDIWRTAEFHEREVFELFGVQFRNHPDLRNLILPDEWTGYPLRKDYEDPVNMIKL